MRRPRPRKSPSCGCLFSQDSAFPSDSAALARTRRTDSNQLPLADPGLRPSLSSEDHGRYL
jgi:hypothetical protein